MINFQSTFPVIDLLELSQVQNTHYKIDSGLFEAPSATTDPRDIEIKAAYFMKNTEIGYQPIST